MNSLMKRYRFFLVMLGLWGFVFFLNRTLAYTSVFVTLSAVKGMLLVVPPIFILLGLLDVWVPRHTMVRFMGEGSGARGCILAMICGAMAAGPLYGAFPVAAAFLKKGATVRNVLIFMGSWSTMKIPLFLFEMQSLGIRFALTRLLVDIPGIILIAWFLDSRLTGEEREKLQKQAERLITN